VREGNRGSKRFHKMHVSAGSHFPAQSRDPFRNQQFSVIYLNPGMYSKTQYGHTLLLDGFQPGTSAERLKRLHFSKTASESAPYDEAWLQRLIMRYPSVLPVDQIEPAFSPLVPVCTELPMQAGSLDNLLVTPAGDLVLIECKLWRNPEARRQVIAQVIDYAKDMSTWTYEKLQQAVRSAQCVEGSGDTAERTLYERVADNGEIDEASFHDAVSRNLQRGRFLLLIVGDGIREGVEGMAEFLQQHAGFHFTLAFVELALFETPARQYIVQPRVLARTTNIDRGIVTLQDGRIVITPPSAEGNGSGRRTTITQERYFELLEKEFPGISQNLNAFIDTISACSVSPEFGTDSLILRWRPDNGRPWNLGTIWKNAVVSMDHLGSQANSEGLLDLHKQYLKSLAELVPGAYIKKNSKETAWNIAQDGKYITIDALVTDRPRRDGWARAIAEFQAAVAKVSHDD